MEDVLVTGSSGFIGSNLCWHLLNYGYTVHSVDISKPEVELPEQIKTHTQDLTESPDLPEADVIVHLAAHSQVQPLVDKPELAVENIEMTRHVLSEAKRMGAFVVNISSRDIYGSSLKPAEGDVTSESPNAYAASKLSGEALANSYRSTQDVSVTSLRLANVYGPRDLNQRVIPIFVALAENGEELTVYGEGKLLDFVYIDDVCRAIRGAISRSGVVDGEIINVGSGTGTSLSDLASRISEYVESCPGWSVSPDRKGDVTRYVSNLSKASALLNFEPETALTDGLEDTVDWYVNRPALLSSIHSGIQEI